MLNVGIRLPRTTRLGELRPSADRRWEWSRQPNRRTTSRRDDALGAAPHRVPASNAGSGSRNGYIRSRPDARRGTPPTAVAGWCACVAAVLRECARSRAAQGWLLAHGLCRPARRGGIGRKQHRFQCWLGHLRRQRPAQPRRRVPLQIIMHRALADVGAAGNLPLHQLKIEIQPQDFSGLAHGHSLSGHRSPPRRRSSYPCFDVQRRQTLFHRQFLIIPITLPASPDH